MNIEVCRRVEDTPPQEADLNRADCESCGKMIFQSGDGREDILLCIHCAVVQHPDLVLFVELPPDQFGHSSLAKGIKEIFEAQNGEWHKHGVWHNQKWVFDRQE